MHPKDVTVQALPEILNYIRENGFKAGNISKKYIRKNFKRFFRMSSSRLCIIASHIFTRKSVHLRAYSIHFVGNLKRSTLFCAFECGRNILGPKSNVSGFTKSDIAAYLEKHYVPDNIVISMSGNIDIKLAEDMVLKYFSGMSSIHLYIASTELLYFSALTPA